MEICPVNKCKWIHVHQQQYSYIGQNIASCHKFNRPFRTCFKFPRYFWTNAKQWQCRHKKLFMKYSHNPKDIQLTIQKILLIYKRGIFLHGKNATLAYYICLHTQHTWNIKPTQQCVSADLGSGTNAIAYCFPAVHKRWHPKGIQYQAHGFARAEDMPGWLWFCQHP